jgi:dTDP-4-dehydrorhamnose reductase
VRILVAGAGGQLGSSLVEALSAHEVVALGHAELDITSLAQVRRAIEARRPDVVVNTAAYNRVDEAESAPDAAYRGNALGPRNLALATADAGATLVHVSTDYVFDGSATRPYHEYDRPAPRSVYGRSKLAGEQAVREITSRHLIVRTAWLYSATGQNFVRTMLSLAARAEIRVVCDQTGSPTYAPHLARALAALLETRTFGTYHLAGQGSATWHELAQALYQRLGIASRVVPIPTAELARPAPRPVYSVLRSIQDPCIALPPWPEGLDDFCRIVGRP